MNDQRTEPVRHCIRCGAERIVGLSGGASIASNGVSTHADGTKFILAGLVFYCATCAPNVVFCRQCGCTDEAACEGGCYWAEPDLCSACKFKAGDPRRNVAAMNPDDRMAMGEIDALHDDVDEGPEYDLETAAQECGLRDDEDWCDLVGSEHCDFRCPFSRHQRALSDA